ncbi:GNAT family N-acetyltransferase [Paracoccus sp. (in: a-proteobacteria)]|uniref:GNAT family N-acetyltransferase n=1 Tax=Paracoccus sp. TaxID=267 RepID=UPI0026DF9914|nr:GNAT family N-acetyltransferase [Paracoccus sp. (in: a-proteobacteria)]MDO5646610.1 GNAT family N-acetyltransferase [Paracoccus sp. (in: a-proteobacteria)]
MIQIRDAGADDLPAIMAIYNHAVEHSTAVWNSAVVDLANRQAWLTDRQNAGFPVIVAVGADGVQGYASFGPWRAFDGYRHTVEHSVYVRHDLRGGGVGTALMRALITRARGAGKHAMIAAIEARNTGSIRLHQRFGFEKAGVFPQVGTKFGGWLDLVFMQLLLDNRAVPDHPPS